MEPPPFNEELSKYPPQPKDSGQNAGTKVQTNYSRVELSGKHLYVYHVSIVNLDAHSSTRGQGGDQQVTEPLVRSEVFAQAQSGSVLSKKYIYFDGKDYAYSPKSLHKHWAEPADELKITLVHSSSFLEFPCQFEVKVRALRKYDTKELQKYCDGDTRVPDSYIQGFMYAVDAIVRSCPKPQFEDLGGRYLANHRPVVTPWGYDIWWEYRLTMRPGQGALFVNIGAKSVPVINVTTNLADLSRLFFEKKVAMLQRKNKAGLEFKDWTSFEPVVRGLQVVEGQSLVGLSGLSTMSAAQMTVDGESLASYYRRKFGQDIGDPSIPCAIAADKRPIPLSLCLLPAGKRQIQAVVGPWQRDDFFKSSAVPPEHRQAVLAHGMRLLAQDDSPDLKAFGIKITPTLESVSARVLDPPRIMLRKHTAKAEPVEMREGRWEMGGKRVVESSQLRSWCVLVFGHQMGMPPALLRTFINQYVKICVELGIDIQQTSPPIKYATAWNDIERVMTEAKQLSETHGHRSQLVLCILPFNSVSLYGEIKRVAMTIVGVQTQCVQSSNVRSHNPKLLTSIALKMNVKLGGFTADLHADDLPGLSQIPTMILSADVNHTTEAGGMSVAAILSSTDVHARRFAGTVLQHPQRMEYIENFDTVIRQSLRLFHRSTGGVKPQRIIYYRDGVNDAQMQAVKQIELAAIYRGCQLIDPQYRPLVTLMLIRKRHHSRFLLDSGNCEPGTCVSGGVVSPAVFSFYLLAHRSPFGVSKPAYYLVLHDDNRFDAEDLKRLTYSLSYMYPIVTRSVTMPAALYYAHRLTGKGRLQLNRAFNTLPHFTKTPDRELSYLVPVHEALRDTMYFM
ncbi:hypothetical protein GGI19_001231 [Coemansia pectinata]|uniref:Piwi domain-containing protein n=1 Tax=Coemansia pectinata TaxID=1052879 RepID=A0A9W8GZB2_9FUNG|nr:hypothetical protein GGI19_001231 [Coemansia pectinata]